MDRKTAKQIRDLRPALVELEELRAVVANVEREAAALKVEHAALLAVAVAAREYRDAERAYNHAMHELRAERMEPEAVGRLLLAMTKAQNALDAALADLDRVRKGDADAG